MPAPTVTIFGNLTKDPELKFSGSGSAWGFFTVANTEWKKENDQWVEAGASFYDVKMFGEAMERVAESFVKGDRVIVIGKLRQETWEKDGEKRSKMVVVADEVGASTKNAVVTMTRVERSGGDGGYQRQAPAPRPGDDEEPFAVPAADWMPGLYGSYPERLLP